MSTTALIIYPTGGVQELEIEPDLDTLNLIVGGYIESVALPFFDEIEMHMYIDEDGKMKARPLNKVATILVDTCRPGFANRDAIVGTAVVLAGTSDGGEASVPDLFAKFTVNVAEAAKAEGLL